VAFVSFIQILDTKIASRSGTIMGSEILYTNNGQPGSSVLGLSYLEPKIKSLPMSARGFIFCSDQS
jgi:hypothetical protein